MPVLSIQPSFQFSYFRFLIHNSHYFSTKIHLYTKIWTCKSAKSVFFCLPFQNIWLYLQCQIIVVINTAECPDRCSIRNWAIFMSIGQPSRGNPRNGTIYEIVEVTQMRNNLRLSFPHFITRRVIRWWFGDREMAAVLVSYGVQENLPKTAKSSSLC